MKTLFLFFGIFILIGCNHSSKNFNGVNLGKINYDTVSVKAIEKAENVRIEFVNNPYQLDSNTKIIFSLNGKNVYKGIYKPTIDFKVKKGFGCYGPYLTIIHKDSCNAYGFLHKQCIEINEEDSIIYIGFFPEKGLVDASIISKDSNMMNNN